MHSKLKYLLVSVTVMLIGLASRHFSSPNSFIYDHVGDALWAVMIYFGFRFLKPQLPKRRTAIIALSFCFLIEISQLYQAPWINAVRQITLGGLILGFGFLWSDLLGYCIGIFAAWLLDTKSSKATTI